MIWAGSSIKEWFIAFLIVTTIAVFTSAALRTAGWSWWARIIILIPIVAVMARIANRVLSTTVVIL